MFLADLLTDQTILLLSLIVLLTAYHWIVKVLKVNPVCEALSWTLVLCAFWRVVLKVDILEFVTRVSLILLSIVIVAENWKWIELFLSCWPLKYHMWNYSPKKTAN